MQFLEYTKCRGCEKDLRPWNAKGEDWPGTILHAGRGYCFACHKRLRVGRRLPIEQPPPPPPPEPRELDPDEKKVLNLLRKKGLPEEVAAMLGFNEPQRWQPLTNNQLMKNSLTANVGIIGDGLYARDFLNEIREQKTTIIRGYRL